MIKTLSSSSTSLTLDDIAELSFAKPLQPINISSNTHLENEFTTISVHLQDVTTVDWEKRVASLQRIAALHTSRTIADAIFLQALRIVRDGIAVQIADLRSAVSRESCALLSYLARVFGEMFVEFADFYIPVLLRLVSVTVQVIAASADSVIRCLLKFSQLNRGIPRLVEGCHDKSIGVRSRSIQYVVLCLKTHDGSILEKYTHLFADVIASKLTDRTESVRQNARRAYWEFFRHCPERAKLLRQRLDDKIRKSLDSERRLLASNDNLPPTSTTTTTTTSIYPLLPKSLDKISDLQNQLIASTNKENSHPNMQPPTATLRVPYRRISSGVHFLPGRSSLPPQLEDRRIDSDPTNYVKPTPTVQTSKATNSNNRRSLSFRPMRTPVDEHHSVVCQISTYENASQFQQPSTSKSSNLVTSGKVGNSSLRRAQRLSLRVDSTRVEAKKSNDIRSASHTMPIANITPDMVESNNEEETFIAETEVVSLPPDSSDDDRESEISFLPPIANPCEEKAISEDSSISSIINPTKASKFMFVNGPSTQPLPSMKSSSIPVYTRKSHEMEFSASLSSIKLPSEKADSHKATANNLGVDSIPITAQASPNTFLTSPPHSFHYSNVDSPKPSGVSDSSNNLLMDSVSDISGLLSPMRNGNTVLFSSPNVSLYPMQLPVAPIQFNSYTRESKTFSPVPQPETTSSASWIPLTPIHLNHSVVEMISNLSPFAFSSLRSPSSLVKPFTLSAEAQSPLKRPTRITISQPVSTDNLIPPSPISLASNLSSTHPQEAVLSFLDDWNTISTEQQLASLSNLLSICRNSPQPGSLLNDHLPNLLSILLSNIRLNHVPLRLTSLQLILFILESKDSALHVSSSLSPASLSKLSDHFSAIMTHVYDCFLPTAGEKEQQKLSQILLLCCQRNEIHSSFDWFHQLFLCDDWRDENFNEVCIQNLLSCLEHLFLRRVKLLNSSSVSLASFSPIFLSSCTSFISHFYSHPQVAIRKRVVNCYVQLFSNIGEDIWTYIDELPPVGQKLVRIYINKLQ